MKVEVNFLLPVREHGSSQVARLLAETFGELIVHLGGKDVKIRVRDPVAEKNLLEHLKEGG